ncbi:MAG TPA: PLDc N-terminal domain-containing protein [Mycobacteriales bacterium]|nr:PLDc N-terminal domain-containing protein [Mycobacteriales bacterium]
MLYARGLLVLVELFLVVYCVLSIITTPPERVRNLPKLGWLLLVLVLPIIGCIAWLVAGRPDDRETRRSDPRIPPAYDRPGRATALDPDDDAAFLRSLHERAEQQRRAERERRQAALEEQERRRALEREQRRGVADRPAGDEGTPAP